MPITYATPELREMMERGNGLPYPDRRQLIYQVTCPMSEAACWRPECEYLQCLSATEASDNTDPPPEPQIRITAVPAPGEPHPMPPLNYEYQWLQAVAEAVLMLDEERLEELDAHQDDWLTPECERAARTELIQALLTLLGHTDASAASKCETCGKLHLQDYHDQCPGCQRLMNPPAADPTDPAYPSDAADY